MRWAAAGDVEVSGEPGEPVAEAADDLATIRRILGAPTG
jgi:hypothetical protein